MEDSVGFKSNLGRFTAPRAQSSQAPLLESANDWKVQFDVNDECVLVKERPFPSEIDVVYGLGSRPDGVIWPMQTNTVNAIHGEKLNRLQALDLQKLGWYDTQVMPNPKPAMRDSTVHSARPQHSTV